MKTRSNTINVLKNSKFLKAIKKPVTFKKKQKRSPQNSHGHNHSHRGDEGSYRGDDEGEDKQEEEEQEVEEEDGVLVESEFWVQDAAVRAIEEETDDHYTKFQKRLQAVKRKGTNALRRVRVGAQRLWTSSSSLPDEPKEWTEDWPADWSGEETNEEPDDETGEERNWNNSEIPPEKFLPEHDGRIYPVGPTVFSTSNGTEEWYYDVTAETEIFRVSTRAKDFFGRWTNDWTEDMKKKYSAYKRAEKRYGENNASYLALINGPVAATTTQQLYHTAWRGYHSALASVRGLVGFMQEYPSGYEHGEGKTATHWHHPTTLVQAAVAMRTRAEHHFRLAWPAMPLPPFLANPLDLGQFIGAPIFALTPVQYLEFYRRKTDRKVWQRACILDTGPANFNYTRRTAGFGNVLKPHFPPLKEGLAYAPIDEECVGALSTPRSTAFVCLPELMGFV